MDLLQTAIASIQEFLERGGFVLVLIMILTFVMWGFILERLAYFAFSHRGVAKRAHQEWSARSDHNSWYAKTIRDQILSEVSQRTHQNVNFIKTCVAVAPLFGLLGTVSGMVLVFDFMAILGSSDARAMSAGVARATLPTMAGMVSALSGLLFLNPIERLAKRRVAQLADELGVE